LTFKGANESKWIALSIRRAQIQTQILKLLRGLKKDSHWLNQFIMDNHRSSPRVEPSLPIPQVLDRLHDHLLAKLLSELSALKKSNEENGYPKDFDSIPAPDIPTSYDEIENRLNMLESLQLTEIESRIMIHLIINGKQSAADISRATGIMRVEIYNNLSTLLQKGTVLSTTDRPQKYYCAPGVANNFTD